MSIELYDTHAHFEDADDTDAIYARAAAAGVTRILAVGGSADLNRNALRTPQNVALGWDRDQVGNWRDPTTGRLRTDAAVAALRAPFAAAGNRLAAVGEVGLDCHYEPETLSEQCVLLEAQLALADERALPVVIHTREADEATLGVLDNVPWRHTDRLRGVIHSYTGNPSFARQLLDRGFMISFSGIATFKRAENVRESVRYVPNDRILVETDAPFLAPMPLRGTRCEPAFVVHTAACLAAERKMPPEAFAALTTANARVLFGDVRSRVVR